MSICRCSDFGGELLHIKSVPSDSDNDGDKLHDIFYSMGPKALLTDKLLSYCIERLECVKDVDVPYTPANSMR